MWKNTTSITNFPQILGVYLVKGAYLGDDELEVLHGDMVNVWENLKINQIMINTPT
jgi:hypothetical protein